MLRLLHYLEGNSIELYNLQEDPGALEEISNRFAEKADRTLERLTDWRIDIDAAMPTANPKAR